QSVQCETLFGASACHYKHWRGPFYDPTTPPARILKFYIRHFDTVEINNSFYRLPSEDALEDWRDFTPPDFLFAVKAGRFITHNKKINDPQSGPEKIFPPGAILGRKIRPIPFQLPPGWNVNPERLEAFLRVLPKRRLYVFEMRNHTWHTEAIYETLRVHNAAFCIFDLAGFQAPLEITADFTYVRLHGPHGRYQ